MIRSFRSRDAEQLFNRRFVKAFSGFEQQVRRKLAMLDAATDLNDLRSPPGNRLEALSGDRSGQHSIRINSQWRVCFRWNEGAAEDVEIVAYH
ncbi:MAG: type II toxin-antitoxin system RelE/ParE family toxin [Notoacmeibacter sp.]|nr:type II toxin-antitoxin system RelE/ParE family toxin [Notoacmeibacter sp.]